MAKVIIPGDTYRSFVGSAQIQAFAEAVFDRYSYGEGLSSDPEITEPGLVFGSKKRPKYVLAIDNLEDTQVDVPTRV